MAAVSQSEANDRWPDLVDYDEESDEYVVFRFTDRLVEKKDYG